MVKHIVFFKLSEVGIAHKSEIIAKLKNLTNEVGCIKDLEVGENFAQEERAFDLALTVIVEDKEKLEEYAKDPKHLLVVEFLKSLQTQTKVVDYEF